MSKKSFLDKVALQIAERIREKATVQGRIPFLTGDLRKSISAEQICEGEATVSSNLVYARAVHDGRGPVVIRPKNKKFLAWRAKSSKGYVSKKTGKAVKGKGKNNLFIFAQEVHQPARKGKPFIREAVNELNREGFAFLNPLISEYVGEEIAREISGSIELDIML